MNPTRNTPPLGALLYLLTLLLATALTFGVTEHLQHPQAPKPHHPTPWVLLLLMLTSLKASSDRLNGTLKNTRTLTLLAVLNLLALNALLALHLLPQHLPQGLHTALQPEHLPALIKLHAFTLFFTLLAAHQTAHRNLHDTTPANTHTHPLTHWVLPVLGGTLLLQLMPAL